MHKFVTLAAVAASVLLASAANASEALPGDVLSVRIPVAGKTQQQLMREIDSAAQTVCRPAQDSLNAYSDCLDHARSSAHAQLQRLMGGKTLVQD